VSEPPDAAKASCSPRPVEGLAGRDQWEWIRPVLTIVSVALPVACAILAAFESHRSLWWGAVGALAALAFGGWTLLLNRRMTTDHDEGRARWPLIYLAGAYLLFAVMVSTSPTYFFVAFALYWQTFSLLELRFAIPSSLVLAILMIGLQLHSNGEGITDDPSVIIGGAASIGFGVLLAVWIGGIIEQSAERRELIAELESTRTELADANHEAGVRAERERMAHEIHDTLAQGFTSIVMLAQAADGEWDRAPEAARQHLQSIERTARDNLAEARNLVEGNAPAPLDRDSLPDALRRLADRLGGDLAITVRTEISGDPHPLPPALEVAILRSAQEALANVRKHAHPDEVTLSLRYGDDETVLEVRDDGTGFDVDAAHAASPGFGLRGMRSRLEQVGGAVDVRSTIGEGTTVTVTLP
jgi:signal transduction histidine kinase